MKLELLHGDCLIESNKIKDGSVDLILTDLPYGTMNGADLNGWKGNKTSWDKAISTVEIHNIANRILRKNGKMVLFGQEPYSSKLIQTAISNLPFNYRMIWLKNHFANSLMAKKAPVSYFEDILVFSKSNDIDLIHPLRKWLKEIQEKKHLFWNDKKLHKAYVDAGIAKNIKSANSICQHKLDWKYAQIQEIKGLHYKILDSFYNFDKTEEELNLIYEKYKTEFNSVFNLPNDKKYKSNILEYKKDYDGFHPTQKPVLLLEDIIKTFSNENDLVVDLTMGSGSTGVACVNTNRNFIGIEMDENYFNIAKNRIL